MIICPCGSTRALSNFANNINAIIWRTKPSHDNLLQISYKEAIEKIEDRYKQLGQEVGLDYFENLDIESKKFKKENESLKECLNAIAERFKDAILHKSCKEYPANCKKCSIDQNCLYQKAKILLEG